MLSIFLLTFSRTPRVQPCTPHSMTTFHSCSAYLSIFILTSYFFFYVSGSCKIFYMSLSSFYLVATNNIPLSYFHHLLLLDRSRPPLLTLSSYSTVKNQMLLILETSVKTCPTKKSANSIEN